ncbi:MAG: M48 family metallopeptidase, partial [Phycisphaerales bacterium]
MKTDASAMDFFEHQDQARKATRRFMFLYFGAVITICVAVGVLFGLLAIALGDAPAEKQMPVALVIGGAAAGLSAVIILCGSVYRIRDLRGGGASVARGLGGIYIDPSTRDPDERRVLNVVEEMAIASGVPVPPVFMMPNEKRINAFAAGYAPGDAVIGVTHACVHGLTRDELQGVMAHEFSHILNGDMRLNIRMIGFLNGILIITIAGKLLFEISPHVGRSREGLAFMFLGFIVAICLVTIGSIGALSSRVIQSAVSRQREFLADASAVQFTRNPHGIADALRRIGGSAGGKIRHPRVEEASHMFFSQAKSLSATLATHPPLKERIKRVLPSWDGTFLDPLIPTDRKEEKKPDPAARLGDRIEDALSQEGANVEALLPLLALSGMMMPCACSMCLGVIIPESAS